MTGLAGNGYLIYVFIIFIAKSNLEIFSNVVSFETCPCCIKSCTNVFKISSNAYLPSSPSVSKIKIAGKHWANVVCKVVNRRE